MDTGFGVLERADRGRGVAAVVLRGSLGNVASLGATRPAGSSGQSFVCEVVLTLTMLLVIVHVASTHPAAGAGAAAVGAAIGLGALVGGPISGGSMNPARSLGPALVALELRDLWIYLTAPFVGALLGVVVYRVLGRRRS